LLWQQLYTPGKLFVRDGCTTVHRGFDLRVDSRKFMPTLFLGIAVDRAVSVQAAFLRCQATGAFLL